MKRAYVVDDDAGFRKSIVTLLESSGWTVEAFASPQAFVEKAPELDPGLLLLDLNMPGKSGLELLESAAPVLDRFAVVMVSGAGAVETAVRTIRAGALDFIEKPFSADELLDRLDRLESALAANLDSKASAIAAKERVDRLSPRELDVLGRLLGGGSNKHVARSLGISPRTVEMHRARLVQKLGVSTTAEALELARSAGLQGIAPG